MINESNYPTRNDHHQQGTLNECKLYERYAFDVLEHFDEHIDYANDEILNMLIEKRDELLRTFR